MMTKNRYCLVFAAIILLAGSAHADTKTVCVVQMTASEMQKMSKEDREMMAAMAAASPDLKFASGAPMTVTHYHQGDRDRFDLTAINTVIEDRAKNQYITIDRTLKVYSVRMLLPYKKKASTDDDDASKMISTDKHETKAIAGRTAGLFVFHDPSDKNAAADVFRVWIDPKAEAEPFMPPLGGGVLEPFGKVANKLPGQCLELNASTRDKDGAFGVTYRVTAISKLPILPAVFEIPQSYKEIPWTRSMLDMGNDDADTKLVDAAATGDLDQIKESLKAGVDVNATDDYGLTPLVAAIRHRANLNDNAAEIVTFLLDHGAKVNTTIPSDDVSPLMEAASGGDIAIVKLLLAHGADPQLKDKNGKTALDDATEKHNVEAIKLLATAGKP